MVWCPAHGRKHHGRIEKAACLASIIRGNSYEQEYQNAVENKNKARKLGKKWSWSALESAFKYSKKIRWD